MSAEQCGWCGRRVTRFIVRDLDTDHGPLRILWCTDVTACSTARAAQPPQPTTPSPTRR